ncbi:hypothetical protein F0Q45_14090 [Mycobacterium simiae]|uniref:Uncharacterized protein n=1 Tax=Mycobacterium simiae TaxID=1784 RepID=A0A5B1BLP7_MYCSI|nr:hypothetical protein F0Q45_14090 [Mycobacterium simiae]
MAVLSTLALGEQFVDEFDFGASWTHLCTVEPARIDPESELGIVPRSPHPYCGMGQNTRCSTGAGRQRPCPADRGHVRVLSRLAEAIAEKFTIRVHPLSVERAMTRAENPESGDVQGHRRYQQ